MFKKMIEKTRNFMKEYNDPEIRKLRQEVAIESRYYNAIYWM